MIILTQWFDPEPALKGLPFAKKLANSGFEVEVVTGFPNYPGGSVYEGYKLRLFHRTKIDNIVLTRLPLYPSHNNSIIGRVFNYLSFSFSAMIYCLFFVKKASVIYAYHPPLTTALVSIVLRIIKKTPVLIDVQDMWPDTLRSTGMIRNEFLLRAIGWACNWVYSKSDIVVVLSDGFKRLLIERNVPKDKIVVIHNWSAEPPTSNCEIPSLPTTISKNDFLVVYAGNIGKAQALDIVITAAKNFQFSNSSIRFLLIGGGVQRQVLQAQIEKEKLDNINMLPHMDQRELEVYLKRANALLVHLKKDPLFTITIPSKVQSYMAAGKPILIGVDGDAGDMVTSCGCGIKFEPENPISLARAIDEQFQMSEFDLQKMGKLGLEYYEENLSLEVGARKFATLFQRLAMVKKNGVGVR